MGSHRIARAARKNDAREPTALAMNALRRIVQSLRTTSRMVEDRLRISGAQLFVLEQLAASPAQSIDEIAGRTLTHQSSVSVVVTRLAARGLVERKRAPADRRRVELRLTRSGRRLVADAPATAQSQLVGALERLPTRDRRSLARGLVALVHEMGLADQQPALFFEGDAKPRRRHA
jgi:DNA-binding MarR family transcriptional regulator